MKPFEVLDHTADIGLVAWGKSLEELFANAALGMFSLIGALEEVDGGFETTLSVEGSDYEDLLVTWLNELLYLFEAEEVLLSRFDILELGQYYLRAKVGGEPIDFEKHELFRVVKACTYHEVKVEEVVPGLFRAQVYFDI
ncbi:MAG: archease [Candidatus Caldatribacterium sp.]|uniref:archease n=1 Tax=Candidatus Caldatribacterium sp. TaxID=2282143 RepID=UPI0029925B62|nr:archease [Candidatus Caldatribacterium sp.]MCX7730693.1 archease [Candidatus Caldatribacterium sp.]MDW8081529.1 archease [Candidatus Calescibacterium sp.]